MKKVFFYWFVFVLALVSNYAIAQCPAGIQIIGNPANPVCKGTAVTFTVDFVTAGGVSSYIWVVNGDTLGTGTSITTSIDGAHVELYAVSDTCNLDTIYDDDYIINTQAQADYNVLVVECNQPVADIEILGITGTPNNEPYSWDLITSDGSLGEQELYKDVPVSAYPLVITDATGCIDTSWIYMDVVICPPPRPVELVTPNEDGRNDFFFIADIEYYPDNDLYIFDRWGQRVYHKNGYDNTDGWDAKYLGSDMPVSTYYYILKIRFEKSEEQVLNGPVSVFR